MVYLDFAVPEPGTKKTIFSDSPREKNELQAKAKFRPSTYTGVMNDMAGLLSPSSFTQITEGVRPQQPADGFEALVGTSRLALFYVLDGVMPPGNLLEP